MIKAKNFRVKATSRDDDGGVLTHWIKSTGTVIDHDQPQHAGVFKNIIDFYETMLKKESMYWEEFLSFEFIVDDNYTLEYSNTKEVVTKKDFKDDMYIFKLAKLIDEHDQLTIKKGGA